jgi:hypothetical protein
MRTGRTGSSMNGMKPHVVIAGGGIGALEGLLALRGRPQRGLPGALPFAGQRDVAAVGDALAALAPGRRHRIVFAVPSPVAWTCRSTSSRS